MLLDTATNNSDTPPPQLGQRVSSVATLVLSLVIPMVTMGFVWPWTGPAASATLAPYLVGIVVQFAFEQYARYRKSPSRSAIPLIFQVRTIHFPVNLLSIFCDASLCQVHFFAFA